MSRVALLIGVSRYPPGLAPLPKALKDVEVMRRALRQPQPGFDPVTVLVDRPLQEMRETIETFFRDRTANDQVIVLFSGYLLQDGDTDLYFATRETAPDPQGQLVRAKAIAARFVQEAMNRSPAKQQILILDTYIRQSFHHQTAPDETLVDLQSQLGGEGRVILTASAITQHLMEPEYLDLWSYSRYLAAGLETAAADVNSNGDISIDEWHNYACRKLQTAAPAMQPELFGSPDTTNQFRLSVPIRAPHISYRKVLEEKLERNEEVDLAGAALLSGRTFLNDLRHSLGLSLEEATEIEFATLHPVRDYRQRVQAYQEQFSRITQGRDVATPQAQSYLNQMQRALGLTDADTHPIHLTLRMVEHQRQREQYQQQLGQYGQLLINTMQHRSPLAESDRELLLRLPQKLQIQAEDASAMETQLLNQIGLQPPTTTSGLNLPTNPDAVSTPSSQVFGGNPTKLQTTEAPAATLPPPIPPPPSPPLQNVSFTPPPIEPAVRLPNHASPPQVDVVDNPNPPPAKPPMKSSATKESRARSYTTWLAPALLLAALGGTIAALWSSNLLGNNSRVNTGLNVSQSVNNAATLINLGYTAQNERLFDDAVRYATDAVNLLKPQCPTGSNQVSTTTSNEAGVACQYLARAYSNRSHAYFAKQNFGQALNDAQQAVDLAPQFVEAQVNLGNARFKRGDRDGALKSYTDALKLTISNTEVKAGIFNNRGNVLFAQGKTQQAIQDYDQAIGLRSNYADAYFNRGVARATLNQTANAISDFQQAAQLYTKAGAYQLADQANNKIQSLKQQQQPRRTTAAPSA